MSKAKIFIPQLTVFLLISVLTTNLSGQVSLSENILKENKWTSLNDSLPQVIFKNATGTQHPIAWFVNERLISESMAKTIDPEQISTINVQKQAIEIDKISYDGQVRMTMKATYQPKLISLNELKSKYTRIGEEPVLLLLDNEVIHGDYNKNLVDECFVLKIIVEKVENKANGTDLYLVRILTRTPENIKKTKEIRIR